MKLSITLAILSLTLGASAHAQMTNHCGKTIYTCSVRVVRDDPKSPMSDLEDLLLDYDNDNDVLDNQTNGSFGLYPKLGSSSDQIAGFTKNGTTVVHAQTGESATFNIDGQTGKITGNDFEIDLFDCGRKKNTCVEN